ncbi:pyridoxal phosphate-dependent aminotransferase [Treponema rectale]|uniref:cysteine-S-conjugate beta-lyase n=1 Tax=Treponema rectale TaxID=744512 RepID=A0A7M1XJN5_9SPIR|nr:pyridoxal phosphate-dependent aminotransferase [Treponema rectale]
MSKYNFDELTNRRNTNSVKWNVEEDKLPMWIADMDFKTAPEIKAALETRVASGIYGYTEPGDDWYEAYINFFEERHHFMIAKDWLVFSTGVVPTISSTVRKLTSVGDNVVVLSPVYNIFYNSIINNQRNILQVPLLYKENEYSIDWENLEIALKDKKTTLLIFCNPANPISKIWSREELERLGKLCEENSVPVLSDEIHCELVLPGKEYIPFASVNETNLYNSIMAIAPTKTFNLAGIQTSAIVIANPELRKKVVRQINTDEVAEPNVFSCPAAIAAFNEGKEWLDELREYLFSNRDYVKAYLENNIPELTLVDGDATYLLWINIDKLNTNSEEFTSFLKEEANLIVNEGKEYGGNGDHFIRLNVACPRARLEEGLKRLHQGVIKFLKR